MEQAPLPNHDEKLLDPTYLETLQIVHIPCMFEDNDLHNLFAKISDVYFEALLQIQNHQRVPPARYTKTALWTWIRAQKPDLENQYWRYANTRGPAAAENLIRAEWEKAHPPRPLGRPAGQLTRKQMRALANARALQILLAAYGRRRAA